MGSEFYKRVHENPIICAISDLGKLDFAVKSPSEVIFLLNGDIFNLKNTVSKVKENNKLIFIHLDLMDGFSKDVIALKYISKNIKPDGIITTKSNLIRIAKDMNIFAIQRLFLLDSLSLESGIKSVRATRPDAVEILPGIMHKTTKYITTQIKTPVITGGLIKDKEDVVLSIKAGAVAISSSNEKVWYM
ncbi:glycerol-3-phosphate responsive antiterminator [Wukongibacter baidiensis]|uniref:glycerol-3-phosphate responsive antiterminator n=1 Tax=Wukongibacter baidiensis TaxID=1723361 RepID=UPI003D7FD43E